MTASGAYRLDRHFARFPGAAFALQADVSGGIVAAGDFVHGYAVDDNLNGVAFANGFECVPFTSWFFRRWFRHFDSVLPLRHRFITSGAALQPEIALMVVHALTFDAVRPDGIGRRVRRAVLHEHANAGVDGFRHVRRETPFDGDLEVRI